MWWAGVDVLLPPRCIVTGEIVGAQGTLSPQIWQDLSFIGDPKCARCGVPFSFSLDADEICEDCAVDVPIFDRARAALVYDDHSRSIILGFKHGDQTHAVHSFVPWLRQAGRSMFDGADYLIPVPLHPWRLLARRYNQAALIADALASEVHIEHLPCALRRVRATPSQGHLSTEERAKNVAKAFDVHRQYSERLIGKNVILIDDVYTTGATVSECARVLKSYGVAHINVLTVARIVRD